MHVTLPPRERKRVRDEIRRAIDASGLSASRWAAEHGWAQSYVAQVLSGAREPPQAMLEAVGLRVVIMRIDGAQAGRGDVGAAA